MALTNDKVLLARIFREHAQREEAEIRRMLSCWVSELIPVLAYDRQHNLLGLTYAAPVGSKPPIVIAAYGGSKEYPQDLLDLISRGSPTAGNEYYGWRG